MKSLLEKCSSSQKSTDAAQDFQDQRSMRSDFDKHSTGTTLRHFGKMLIFPAKIAHSPSRELQLFFCKKSKRLDEKILPTSRLLRC